MQVDPSNPKNIHALVMSVPNVTTADTVGNAYPNRNCFYVFSSDGGVNWTAPEQVSPTRAGFPAMVLRKNAAGQYLPVIALHRYTTSTSTDFITSLYIDTGAPGDGKFVGMDADRSLADGSNGDIIWPSIALSADGSKAYVVSAFSPPTGSSNYDFLQFGIFTLSDAGPTAWSGWKQGPDDGNGDGISTNGEHVLAISQSGILGLAWASYNFNNNERGLYYAESKDEGTTWINQKQLWEPVDSVTEIPNASTAAYLIAHGIDLVYEGDVPHIAFSAYDDQGVEQKDSYYPESGTLGFWTPSTGPILLLSKTRVNALNTGDFLSTWSAGDSVDIEGDANLEYATLAHPSGGPEWIIYFQAWANQDVALAYDTSTYAYFGIYRMVTRDNGATWSLDTVRSNDLSSSGQKFDYRYPEVSTFIPNNGTELTLPIMFGADTAAGYFGLSSAGKPGWDNMDWYYQSDSLTISGDGVHSSNKALELSDLQNYPNPVGQSCEITYSIPTASSALLTVSDMLGRTVKTLVSGMVGPGEHSIQFNGGDLPNGVYRYTLRVNGESITKSMSLLR